MRPNFATVDSYYLLDHHDCPDIATSPNQCAVRLSRALIASGLAMDRDYVNNLCRHGYARGAQDLAAFLRVKWGARDAGFEAPGEVPAAVRGVHGVIMFANIPGFDGQGHIDLWDGADIRSAGGRYWTANPIWLWRLP